MNIPRFIIDNLKKYGNVAIGKNTFANFEKNKESIINCIQDIVQHPVELVTHEWINQDILKNRRVKIEKTYSIKIK